MAGRAAKMAAKAFGKKPAVPSMKTMGKPSAKKEVKPVKLAVGGAAKQRLGQATDSGKQGPRLTAPVKTQKAQPKRVV
jgi:hypothetical protein